jgi:Bacterioferritin-associated ferredoxin
MASYSNAGVVVYVCICRAVSDRAVRREVDAGACTVRELRQRLGLGSVCGRCVPEARRLIVERQAELPHQIGAAESVGSATAHREAARG